MNTLHTLEEIEARPVYIPDETGDTFGHMDINGTLYPVQMTLSPDIPDELCNSIEIDGTRYHFDINNY